MSRIYGDKAAIKRAEAAKAGDKSMYINMDAIRELPDEYEAVVTEVTFDPKNLKADFSDVGSSNWMPQTQLMYRIAEACGIGGGDRSVSKPIVEEIDINPMLMLGMTEVPTVRKMTVGRSVTKFSTRMQEDGTPRTSSPCNAEYNVWDRCVKEWADEELESNNYEDVKTGKYQYFGKDKWGDHIIKGKYASPIKYNSALKRRAHFQGEMKFAHAKCETKAHTKTIRELAGLMTGYSADDLKIGKLVFAKIRRSREAIKAEAAARLTAISRGGAGEQSTALLFGPQNDVAETEADTEDVAAVQTEDAAPAEETVEFIVPEEEPEKSKRDQLLAILKIYAENGMIVPTYVEAGTAMIRWLEANEDAEDRADIWEKAVTNLRLMEEKIPEEGQITHTIY